MPQAQVSSAEFQPIPKRKDDWRDGLLRRYKYEIVKSDPNSAIVDLLKHNIALDPCRIVRFQF